MVGSEVSKLACLTNGKSQKILFTSSHPFPLPRDDVTDSGLGITVVINLIIFIVIVIIRIIVIVVIDVVDFAVEIIIIIIVTVIVIIIIITIRSSSVVGKKSYVALFSLFSILEIKKSKIVVFLGVRN